LVRWEVKLAYFDAQIGRAPQPPRYGSGSIARNGSVALDHSRICDRMIAHFSHRRAPQHRVHRRHRAGGEAQGDHCRNAHRLIFMPHSSPISASSQWQRGLLPPRRLT